ncbi:hypothetical protein AwWohl_05240 [Gammaproteobacteria bacterium]|nr:hypothetical protein AwWohl_05240 [Gammaproteobacteria bacterium]
MRYCSDSAIGLIETLGMGPALAGADSMLKAASVQLIAYENIGSTLVSVMIKGDVAAVQAAVDAGVIAATAIGKLTASNVMANPVKSISDIAAVHGIESECALDKTPKALGLIETFGIVYILQAADAMLKAADVELIGYENVASGYISVLVQGDVAAVQAAVEAGIKSVEQMQAAVYSSLVIPSPHPDLQKITKRYLLENLLA